MQVEICSDIKDLVAQYLLDNLRASASFGGGCAITLPIKTLDDRWVSVIVEPRYDYYFVHDAGKTDSALFSHGIKMSDADEQFNVAVAAKYGVEIREKVIQKMCRRDELCGTILALAESSAVMTAQLISSRLIEIEVQEMQGVVLEALRLWKPEDVIIDQNVEIQAGFSTHRLNFVAKSRSRRTATINILPPSRPRDRAERYGFMRLDMQRTDEFKDWASGAVILGVEAWTKPALEIVKRLADTTVELTSNTQSEVEAHIPAMMEHLRATEMSV